MDTIENIEFSLDFLWGILWMMALVFICWKGINWLYYLIGGLIDRFKKFIQSIITLKGDD